ncbi:MAG: transcriptional regulator NrdR [Oscillospiraceae bacterium]|jgi:transcriptional repressor NrdR|nr:transcriptional regulator NrdR [Oscillospiraceae bacterium]
MKCPSCETKESKVLESRSTDDCERIRRRRECYSCGKRFTTFEMIENTPISIVKKDGSREFFERKKVFDGLLKACQKRPVPISYLDETAKDIENKLQNMFEREIDSSIIGEMAMQALRNKDEVAYVRFASVYRQFKDVKEFLKELENVIENYNKSN